MQYEDRLSIPTPEGVELELTLAGVGSRFVAFLIDQAIQWAVIIALVLALAGLGDGLGGGDGGSAALVAAAVLVLAFLVQLVYDVGFETLGSGRTPGKRWTGLRVVRMGGGAVNFTTSAVRNVLRLVDFLPTAYLVGMVAILATPRNQRLGDLVAGTLVVRERRASTPPPPPWEALAPGTDEDLAAWDVSAVTADEVATVRRFLERRHTLAPEARGRLARELASRLRPKVAGPPSEGSAEAFLAALVAAKARRG